MNSNIIYRNVNEAKKIHALAEQARNTTVEAYNLAKKAISKYSNMTCVFLYYSNTVHHDGHLGSILASYYSKE